MSVFDKRITIEPVEYPEAVEFLKAIRHTMWFIDEYRDRLLADISDYKYKLNPKERNVIKKCLLAISTIEVKVKEFWGDIGKHLPKPEIHNSGVTLSHNEVIHEEAYAELLKRLDLWDEFQKVFEVPAILGRVEYLTKYLKGASHNSKENYTLNLLLFSFFIESCSLFSQFYIVKSFCYHKNVMKSIDNIIMATAKEEDIHFQFGAYLIKTIRKEYPEWFNEDFYNKIYRACDKALTAELGIIDWIFEEGELDFCPKDEVVNFLKDRFNKSLKEINLKEVYEIDVERLENSSKWFEEERVLDTIVDFFDKKSPNYTIGNQDISAETLF